MKDKKNIYFILTVIVIILALIGAIVATALLSKDSVKDWNYDPDIGKLDYGSVDNDTDFQYLTNFRNAFIGYFDDLFGDFFSKYLNINKFLSAGLEKTADKLILALEEARIPSVKLNRMALALKNNAPGSVFKRIKEDISKISDMHELQEYLEDKIGGFTLLSLLCNATDDIMRETTLTENEIAETIYCYFKQNAKDDSLKLLDFWGKDFFISLASNTVYVMSTVNRLGKTDYISGTTAQSVKTVLYQLGSLYTEIASFPEGRKTFERILGLSFEYDETVKNHAQLNSYGRTVSGKIGGLLAVVGCFMKNLSKDDIEYYCKYLTASDEKEKSDLKIQCAIRFSKVVDKNFEEMNELCGGTFGNVNEMAMSYVEVNRALGGLAFSVFEGLGDEFEISQPESYEKFFAEFADAVAYMSTIDLQNLDLKGMSADSEYYKIFVSKSDAVFGIESGLMGVCDNLFTAKLSDSMYAIISEGVGK